MRLAYITYGVGHARLALYRDPKENTAFTVRFADLKTGKETAAAFTSFAPMILAGPAMLRRNFALEAWKDNRQIGECYGEFIDGLRLVEKTGYFEKVQQPRPLIEYETIEAAKSEESAGLSPTDIVLLSRKWSDDRQLHAKSPGLQWWDNDGLTEEQGGGARRFTGWSLERGAFCDLHAAIVAVTSGPQQGKAGLLLWGDNGGIRVGGGLGETRSAAWLPSLDSVPQRVSKIITLPPYSVTQRNTPISSLALSMI